MLTYESYFLLITSYNNFKAANNLYKIAKTFD